MTTDPTPLKIHRILEQPTSCATTTTLHSQGQDYTVVIKNKDLFLFSKYLPITMISKANFRIQLILNEPPQKFIISLQQGNIHMSPLTDKQFNQFCRSQHCIHILKMADTGNKLISDWHTRNQTCSQVLKRAICKSKDDCINVILINGGFIWIVTYRETQMV